MHLFLWTMSFPTREGLAFDHDLLIIHPPGHHPTKCKTPSPAMLRPQGCLDYLYTKDCAGGGPGVIVTPKFMIPLAGMLSGLLEYNHRYGGTQSMTQITLCTRSASSRVSVGLFP